jgi:hypothetical protein
LVKTISTIRYHNCVTAVILPSVELVRGRRACDTSSAASDSTRGGAGQDDPTSPVMAGHRADEVSRSIVPINGEGIDTIAVTAAIRRRHVGNSRSAYARGERLSQRSSLSPEGTSKTSPLRNCVLTGRTCSALSQPVKPSEREDGEVPRGRAGRSQLWTNAEHQLIQGGLA